MKIICNKDIRPNTRQKKLINTSRRLLDNKLYLSNKKPKK